MVYYCFNHTTLFKPLTSLNIPSLWNTGLLSSLPHLSVSICTLLWSSSATLSVCQSWTGCLLRSPKLMDTWNIIRAVNPNIVQALGVVVCLEIWIDLRVGLPMEIQDDEPSGVIRQSMWGNRIISTGHAALHHLFKAIKKFTRSSVLQPTLMIIWLPMLYWPLIGAHSPVWAKPNPRG